MFLLRGLSLVLVVVALMLLGADIVSTLEASAGVRVIRPLDKILLLFGQDMKPWVIATFSPQIAKALLAVLSTPGWATLGIVGVVLTLIVPGRREPRREGREAPPTAH